MRQTRRAHSLQWLRKTEEELSIALDDDNKKRVRHFHVYRPSSEELRVSATSEAWKGGLSAVEVD